VDKSDLMHQLALWADQLRDLSAMGLLYEENIYQRENYTKVQAIALEMLAAVTSTLPDEIEVLGETLFRHPTPISAAGGAVINENGEILLIQRADNAHWALPGGAVEVGETSSAAAVREILEETGVACKPIALVGVHDSLTLGVKAPLQYFAATFLCQPIESVEPVLSPSHVHESLNIKWFSEGQLPQPMMATAEFAIPHAFKMWRGETTTAYYH